MRTDPTARRPNKTEQNWTPDRLAPSPSSLRGLRGSVVNSPTPRGDGATRRNRAQHGATRRNKNGRICQNEPNLRRDRLTP